MPKPKRRAPIVPPPKASHVKKGKDVSPGKKPASGKVKYDRSTGPLNKGEVGGDPDRTSHKRQRDSSNVHGRQSKRFKQTEGSSGSSRRHPSAPGGNSAGQPWRPVSNVHQQAAFALQRLLEADSSHKRGASLKSLTLAPHVVAKKATYAVTCQVLKFSRILEQLDERSGLSTGSAKLGKYVAYVLMYELLRGEGLTRKGQAERAVLAAEPKLRALVDEMQREAGVQSLDELLAKQQQQGQSGQHGPDGEGAGPDVPHPRWVRVNTLKADVDEVVRQLDEHLKGVSQTLPSKQQPPKQQSFFSKAPPRVARDPLMPELLALPPGTALHDHPLVTRGSAVLQSKASCMPARALAPEPGWTVVDCCAAPGNKTTHLAAVMGNTGRVIAFDKDSRRLARLKANASLTGARCIEARLVDFLSIDPTAPEYSEVRGVLLDPSCSGSGTTFTRMDHLLPSHQAKRRRQPTLEPTAAVTAGNGGTGQAGNKDDDDDDDGNEGDEGAENGTAADNSNGAARTKAQHAPAAGSKQKRKPSRPGFTFLDPDPDPDSKVPGSSGNRALEGLDPGLDLDPEEAARVAQLSRFQAAALAHALRFPALERLVYSTCSVYVAENEGVVAGALEQAEAAGLKLVDPFPCWHRRGLPLFPGAEKLVRTDAYLDGTDGFFVAVFQRLRNEEDAGMHEAGLPEQGPDTEELEARSTEGEGNNAKSNKKKRAKGESRGGACR